MFGLIRKDRKSRQGAVNSWGYRIHDGAAQFRFELEGPLASADVRELDQCWRTAASTINGKPLVIDTTALTSVDESGRDLLNRWREAGAQFIQRASLVAVLFAVVFSAASRAAESTSQTPMAANAALTRYLAGMDDNRPWGAETVDIEASLPKLKEQGRLRAIRRLLPLGKPEYQVFELNGSRTVKQQVIARYLTADVTAAAMAPSSVAVTPANYQFRYVGVSEMDGGTAYVFQITPRKKRDGLIQGALWIDSRTGSAVRLSGYLVKRPSIFIKRVDVTREATMREGVVESRVTHLALETRLVGRAQLTIHERPCIDCSADDTRGSN